MGIDFNHSRRGTLGRETAQGCHYQMRWNLLGLVLRGVYNNERFYLFTHPAAAAVLGSSCSCLGPLVSEVVDKRRAGAWPRWAFNRLVTTLVVDLPAIKKQAFKERGFKKSFGMLKTG